MIDPLNTIAYRLFINNNDSNKIITDKFTIKFWLDYWNYIINNKYVIFINYNKLILQKNYKTTTLINKKYINKNSFDYKLWSKYTNNNLIKYIKSNKKLINIIINNFILNK